MQLFPTKRRWPCSNRFIAKRRASGDLTLAVKTWGDPARSPVVLVHGYPDDSSVWQHVAPLLARKHYVIAYDEAARACPACRSARPTTTAKRPTTSSR